jgi:SAM-dependent methyltransferase
LQCHFGLDTLRLARRGAIVTGLDYSPKAIATARQLGRDTGLDARFVEGDVHDAPGLIQGRFDIVFVTWGAICWLSNIRRWAEIAAGFVAPGGFLYLLEAHPVVLAMMQRDDASFRIMTTISQERRSWLTKMSRTRAMRTSLRTPDSTIGPTRSAPRRQW